MRLGLRRATLVAALAVAPMAFGVSSCNPYDLVLHDQFAQGSFNSNVDILWVVDNSNSMARIQEEVQTHFGSFISQFANISDEGGQELAYDTIGDATVAWAEFLQNQERFLNFQMGVTTTNTDWSGNGNTGNIRNTAPVDGQGGGSCQTPTILDPGSENIANVFVDLVDVGVNGSGDERGLQAAALALCKSQDQDFWDGLDERPDDDPIKLVCSLVPAGERFCNDGFKREGAATVIITVSDEGDDTERLPFLPPPEWISDCELEHNDDPFFGQCQCEISWWLDFFDNIGEPVIFATIGPTYQHIRDETVLCDGSTVNIPGPCNPFGANLCSVDFYQEAACLTGGLFTPIEINVQPNPDDIEEPAQCVPANFEEALGNIGALISNLSRGWVLSAIPDEDTITVIKNGDETVPNIADSPSGGWRYVPQNRAIAFSGEGVPNYEDVIDVYYLPQFDRSDQVGRDLPF